VEPVICGLDGEKPFICAMDLIGAPLFAEDFVLAGASSSEALYGVCETLYRPDLVSNGNLITV
jgi:20S proteasome subunit beta 3